MNVVSVAFQTCGVSQWFLKRAPDQQHQATVRNHLKCKFSDPNLDLLNLKCLEQELATCVLTCIQVILIHRKLENH